MDAMQSPLFRRMGLALALAAAPMGVGAGGCRGAGVDGAQIVGGKEMAASEQDRAQAQFRAGVAKLYGMKEKVLQVTSAESMTLPFLPAPPFYAFVAETTKGDAVTRGYATADGRLLVPRNHPQGLADFLRATRVLEAAPGQALDIARRIAWVYAFEPQGALTDVAGTVRLVGDPKDPVGGDGWAAEAVRAGKLEPTLARENGGAVLRFGLLLGGQTGLQLLYEETLRVSPEYALGIAARKTSGPGQPPVDVTLRR